MPCSECDQTAVAEAWDRSAKRWVDLCEDCIERLTPDRIRYFKVYASFCM